MMLFFSGFHNPGHPGGYHIDGTCIMTTVRFAFWLLHASLSTGRKCLTACKSFHSALWKCKQQGVAGDHTCDRGQPVVSVPIHQISYMYPHIHYSSSIKHYSKTSNIIANNIKHSWNISEHKRTFTKHNKHIHTTIKYN